MLPYCLSRLVPASKAKCRPEIQATKTWQPVGILSVTEGKFLKRKDVKERSKETYRERNRLYISGSEKEKQEVAA